MMRFVMSCAVMSMAAYAQFIAPVPGPDASDIWMRNQLIKMATDVNVAPASAPVPTPTPGIDASDVMIRSQLANMGTVKSSGTIGGMADAQKGIYEAEGRWFEKSSKFYARQEYQSATHRTFDPDDPPERGTSAREHWDAAKRIYDIFGK